MKYEDIIKTEKYQAILLEIPEEDRGAVEDAIRGIAKDFEEKVLIPLETHLLKK